MKKFLLFVILCLFIKFLDTQFNIVKLLDADNYLIWFVVWQIFSVPFCFWFLFPLILGEERDRHFFKNHFKFLYTVICPLVGVVLYVVFRLMIS